MSHNFFCRAAVSSFSLGSPRSWRVRSTGSSLTTPSILSTTCTLRPRRPTAPHIARYREAWKVLATKLWFNDRPTPGPGFENYPPWENLIFLFYIKKTFKWFKSNFGVGRKLLRAKERVLCCRCISLYGLATLLVRIASPLLIF